MDFCARCVEFDPGLVESERASVKYDFSMYFSHLLSSVIAIY